MSPKRSGLYSDLINNVGNGRDRFNFGKIFPGSNSPRRTVPMTLI